MTPKLFSSVITVFLEICYKCYTGCPWCYQGDLVSPKAGYVPFEVLKTRIDWIIKNCDFSEIGLIGGEPFLHPDYKKICDYILSVGKFVRTTTSGKISKLSYELANLEYALELYAQGKMKINLSLQPGRNEKDYIYLLGRIKEIYPQSRENGKKLGNRTAGDYDLFTMVAMDASFVDREKARKMLDFVVASSDYMGFDAGDPVYDDVVRRVERAYFRSFAESSVEATCITPADDNGSLRHEISMANLSYIKVNPNGSHTVTSQRGQICNAALAKAEKNTILFQTSLYVRCNGDLTWAVPKCIPKLNGLCNVDIHTDQKEILTIIKKSLGKILRIAYVANRKKAADNCGPDGKEVPCTDCPFDDMCSPCHSLERSW